MREAADDAALVEALGDAIELFERHAAGFARAAAQRFSRISSGLELALQLRSAPAIRDRSVRRCSCRCTSASSSDLLPGSMPAPADVADAQREQALGRHQRGTSSRRSCCIRNSQCFSHRVALRHLQRRPEPILASRRSAASVERMTTWPENGSSFEHVVERGVELLLRHLPRDQRSPWRGSSPSASAARGGSCRRGASPGCAR